MDIKNGSQFYGNKDKGKPRETEVQRVQKHQLLHFTQQEEDQGKT